MLVPNLLELSDISRSAMLAISTACLVFPPHDCINALANDVACSIYSLADTPDVLKAFIAYFLSLSALEPKRVSTPPIDCCSFPPSVSESPTTFPSAPVARTLVNDLTTPLPKIEPPCAPFSDIGFSITSLIEAVIPLALGTICI